MTDFLRRFLPYVRPFRGRVTLGIVSGILFAATNALLLTVVRVVVDLVFPGAGKAPGAGLVDALPGFLSGWARGLVERVSSMERPGALVWGIGMIPVVMLLRGVFEYVGAYSMTWAATQTMAAVQQAVFRHLHGLSMGFFGANRTGELMSRISNDPAMLRHAVSHGFSVAVRDPVQVVVLATLLATQQPRLMALSLALLPVCVVPVVVYGRKVRKAAQASQAHVAEQAATMNESFSGQRVVKAYGLEGFMIERFGRASRKFVSETMRAVRGIELPGPMIEFAGSLGMAGVFVYVALTPSTGVTAGDFLQFVLGLFMLYKPIKELSRLQALLQQARAASERVFELLATRPEIMDPARPEPVDARGRDIELDHVTFAYDERPVLRDVSLRIPAGSFVAVVGPSGSGKSTLAALLLRLHDPQQGSVRVGGIDVRAARMSDVRAQFAVVTQEPVLFSESIAVNVGLGREGASRGDIERAARLANAHDFIMERPGGYDAQVGDRGGSLSGGQRQRIAIARAILRDAPVLVLDEATSALDSESERAVQDALERLMVGRTTLCIAHRLSTVQKADRIVVMEDGRIVEEGTHPELVARGGLYARLYQLQAGGS